MVRYRECLLRRRFQRLRQGDAVELSWARMISCGLAKLRIKCPSHLDESYSISSLLKAGWPGSFLSLTSRPPTLPITSASNGM